MAIDIERFIERGRLRWQRLAQLLDQAEGSNQALGRERLEELLLLYRQSCSDLNLARSITANPELLDRIKQLEFQGYELEAAEGTFELLVREALRPGLQFFEVVSYETTTKSSGSTTATETLKAQDGVHSATAQGMIMPGPADITYLRAITPHGK